VLLLADVAGQQQCCAAGLADQGCGFLGVFLLVGQVRDGDVRAFSGVRNGDSTPDSRVTAGDERPLARELAGASVGVFTMVRAWRGVVAAVRPGCC